jgi:hypothetical protein
MELPGPPAVDDSTGKEDLAMRVDYHKAFPAGMRAMAELERAVHSATAVEAEFSPDEIAALTFAIVAINGWNRLAVGLRSDVLSLDGLDLPGNARAAGSA